MIKSIEATGKTEEEAIVSALSELGASREEVSVEVLERSKSGFLGIGAVPARVRVSYETCEGGADRAERYIRGLLDCMGVTAEITVTESEGDNVYIDLNGSGMGVVIGRRGETLDAIQHLVNYSANRDSDKRVHITVDAEGYRRKREESLVHLAEKMAAKALKYHRSMALEPMNSYERHIIHSALQDYEGVTTASVGVEPNRRVVVNCDRGDNAKPKSREWS